MKWSIGACGTYTDYKGYTIINQEHPKLDKYEITKGKEDLELEHIDTANTLKACKAIINAQTRYNNNY